MCTKRSFLRRLPDLPPNFGFEPLPVLVDQRKHGDGGFADVRSKNYQVIEGLFGFRIQNRIAIQSRNASGFLRGSSCVHDCLHPRTCGGKAGLGRASYSSGRVAAQHSSGFVRAGAAWAKPWFVVYTKHGSFSQGDHRERKSDTWKNTESRTDAVPGD